VLPVAIDGGHENGTRGIFASAALGEDGRTVIVKLVNPGTAAMPVMLTINGQGAGTSGEAWVLSGTPDAENTFARPDRVKPTREPITASGRLGRSLPPSSLTVIRLTPR